METDHVLYAVAELAATGNGFKSFLHKSRDVVADICKGVECRNINPSVIAVTIVHYMSYTVASECCAVRHSRPEHTYEIGFNLEIYVVRVGIVHPMSGFGRIDSVEDIVTCSLVRVPEFVICICETVGINVHRGVDAILRHHFEEGQVHIDIVIKSRVRDEGFIDIILAPRNGLLILHQTSLEFELCRTAVGASYGLGEPASAHLVFQDLAGQGDLLTIAYPAAGTSCKYEKCKYVIA